MKNLIIEFPYDMKILPQRNTHANEIWKDRKDIADSLEYVNRIRQPRWKRSE